MKRKLIYSIDSNKYIYSFDFYNDGVAVMWSNNKHGEGGYWWIDTHLFFRIRGTDRVFALPTVVLDNLTKALHLESENILLNDNTESTS